MNPETFNHRVAGRISALLGRVCPADGNAGLLVALSGGPDSVALLLAARAWADATGRPMAAAHLNHGLRDDAGGDEAFCADLCARLAVPLHRRTEDPRPVARSRGGGIEEAGRHLRRHFLRDVLAAEPGLGAVATGHHRDDQAETVIMRLLRGTGPDGLRGIRAAAPPFVRPLLAERRADLVAYLQAVGQPWREDVTNTDGDNARARLRRELLPVARGIFGPGCADAAARLADLLDADLDLLERLTTAALDQVRRPDGLDVPALLALDPTLAGRALRRWLGETGTAAAGEEAPPPDLGHVHVEAALAWLRDGTSGSGLDLPGGLRLRRDLDLLRSAPSDAPPLRRAEDYRIVVERAGGDGPAATTPGDLSDESTWSLTLPADALSGNLRVRNWRSGDRFQPFGLDGTKKLSDLFLERRLPAPDRPGILVVEDDAGILWVVGLARAERTRLLPQAGPTVTMTVVPRHRPAKRRNNT